MSFCVNLTQNQQSSCKKWNAGLYIRLSREDGDKLESESVTSQRDLLHDFLSRNPDLNLYDVYIDGQYVKTLDGNFVQGYGTETDVESLYASPLNIEEGHIVTIKKNPESKHAKFTIVGFLVS